MTATDKTEVFDAVIVGAGIVGATLASLLGQAGKRIALIEARSPGRFDPDEGFDLRVSAINRASQETFESAGLWTNILLKRAHAYESMQVWDENGSGEVRFDAAEIGAPNLGHIIENRVIQSSLLECLGENNSVTLFCPSRVVSIEGKENKKSIMLDTGERLATNLVVGADGPSSAVRDLMDISVEREDYGQKGLVAAVKTEHGHQDTAWQRFLSGGPLALLPLDNGYSSIVWSLPSDQAARYLKLADKDFCRLLAEASEYRLGGVVGIGKRAAFPLIGSQASAYVGSGFALVGDAAHTIHPLAGQGVNLGIKDAVVLSEILLPLSSRDWGSYKQLRRYERARKGENLLAMKVMEGFRDLFGHDTELVKLARNTGLNLFNSMPLAKRQIMRNAMGL